MRSVVDELLTQATQYPRCSHYLDYSKCEQATRIMAALLTAQSEVITRLTAENDRPFDDRGQR